MYQVSIFNENIETIVHYPSADISAPKLIGQIYFKKILSQADLLTFTIPITNPGYNLVEGLLTKVIVTDLRNDSIKFSGRILIIEPTMDNQGKFTKVCTCEGALNFLNDTNTRRWNFEYYTPEQVIRYLLNEHNSKVDSTRQIQPGNFEITQEISIYTNYETTLNAIIKLRNLIGGEIVVRKESEVLYLDILNSVGNDNGVRIDLGYNMKEIMLEYDPSELITRIIPLGYGEGINQLTIKNANNGIDYIEDSNAIEKYGIIESAITNSELQNASTLFVYGKNILNQNNQPRLTLEVGMLDLSLIAGHELETFDIGDILHINNDVLNIEDWQLRVIELEIQNLMEPWNPTLTFSTKSTKLTDQLVEVKQKALALENAPQGSTYMDTYGFADNVDATHNFKMPILTSIDIVDINRVRLYIEPQKYKANSLSSDLGGNGVLTSTSVVGATAHTHDVTVPNHTHALIHGMIEETYPAGGQILINGVAIPGISVNSNIIDIDITDYINQPGVVYKLEITSSQKGRINAWVSIQAFIQAK